MRIAFAPAPLRRHFAAFTLVELLVVLAIIGILVSLLLPAVQSAREAARQVKCQNNLKQIGLGVVQHESTHEAMPVGCIGCQFVPPKPGGAFVPQRFLAWNIQILPFLEQSALHDRFDFDVPSYRPPNRQAGSTVLDTFLCPSTPGGEDRNAHGLWKGMAFTDYGGVYGVEGSGRDRTDVNSTHWLAAEFLGVMLYEQAVKARDIRDGLSQTVMIAESHLRRVTENEWANGNNLFAQEGATPINAPSGLGNDIGSPHPGGAYVLFCDGHVRFLNDSMSQDVLNSLLTKNGGEVLVDVFE